MSIFSAKYLKQRSFINYQDLKSPNGVWNTTVKMGAAATAALVLAIGKKISHHLVAFLSDKENEAYLYMSDLYENITHKSANDTRDKLPITNLSGEVHD